jgi:hypothetical protein
VTPDELAAVAAQLVARVRDDAPDANARWLNALTNEKDRYALLFVLAAAVPDDKTWGDLTMWVYRRGVPVSAEIQQRRQVLDEALRPRKVAGVSQHEPRSETSHPGHRTAA